MKTYQDHGINWMWYLDATIQDGKVTIHNHYRIHKGEGNHPETSGSYRLIEDSSRTVIQAKINGEFYPVTNPQYVFSYGK